MQTFKTYEELMTHYWGKIVPMAQAAGIKPWECVRSTVSCNLRYADHPKFDDPRNNAYTFAISILEGKPVFVGDRLYSNGGEYCHVEEASINLSSIGRVSLACVNWDNWTWTPPAKKRTFMLNGQEYSSPINDVNGCRLDFLGVDYYFETVRERNNVASAINNILQNARDKE